MKRAALGDHVLARDRYQSFKAAVERMGGTVTADGEVRFTVDSLILTRPELEAFDEKGHWRKILDICRDYGFSPMEV